MRKKKNGTGKSRREVVALLRPLFAIENQAREASASERPGDSSEAIGARVGRNCGKKLLVWKEQLIPQHPMADAVNYILNHWTELKRFSARTARLAYR